MPAGASANRASQLAARGDASRCYTAGTRTTVSAQAPITRRVIHVLGFVHVLGFNGVCGEAASTMTRPLAGLGATAMLTHFTRASRGADALDNLVAILRGGVIRGSSRMVRGKSAAVCLFDASPGELSGLLARKNRRRYERFGVALDRRYAFKMGARPVIYMPWPEAQRILAADEMWRVVAIDLAGAVPVDWTFEREWRVPGDLPLPSRGAVALVESWRDADEIYERFDGDPPCAGVIPLKDLFGAAR